MLSAILDPRNISDLWFVIVLELVGLSLIIGLSLFVFKGTAK